jgi:HlyD family secretion protein
MMNESDQTFRVDAEFTNNLQQPFIHSSVEANIIIRKKENALIIPGKAMIGRDSVQIRQSGKATTIAVKTGIQTLDNIEILSGLDESSEVIVPGQK